jgi:hypothetical protein
MVGEHDVLIVLHGPIREVVQRNTMDTVRHVSSISFPQINEVRSYIRIPRKFVFAMQLMKCLKDLFMMRHFIPINAIVQ